MAIITVLLNRFKQAWTLQGNAKKTTSPVFGWPKEIKHKPFPKKKNLFLTLLSSSFSVMNPPSPLFATSFNHTKKRKKRKNQKREPLDLTLSSLPFPAFGLLLRPLLYCFSSFYLKFILPFLKLPLPAEKSHPKADPPSSFWKPWAVIMLPSRSCAWEKEM